MSYSVSTPWSSFSIHSYRRRPGQLRDLAPSWCRLAVELQDAREAAPMDVDALAVRVVKALRSEVPAAAQEWFRQAGRRSGQKGNKDAPHRPNYKRCWMMFCASIGLFSGWTDGPSILRQPEPWFIHPFCWFWRALSGPVRKLRGTGSHPPRRLGGDPGGPTRGRNEQKNI